jgi:hypothetical protein
MGVFSLGGAVGAIVDVLQDLNLDEYEIRQVVRTLTEGSTDLGDSSFHRTARIAPASFGGSDTAQALGSHHERAYQVIDDTIQGVVRDLETFRDNVRTAVELVTRADETAAGDMDARRQRVADAMTYVWHNSAGDHANHDARNNQLGGGDH